MGLKETIKDIQTRYEAIKDVTEIYRVRLKALEELSKVINSNQDLEETLNNTLDLIIKLFQVPSGSIYLFAPNQKYMEISVARGEKAEEVKKYKIELGEGIAGKVALTGQPIIVSDVKNSTDYAFHIGREINYIPENILCVPIKIKEKILGVIEIMDKPSGFNNDDMNLLTSIANSIGMVIENINIYKLLNQNFERLSKLIEVSKVINTTLELRTLLEYIMNTAKAVLKAEGSSLMLIDKNRKELYFDVVAGDSGEVLKQIRIPIGTGIAGLVAQTGEAILVEDAENDSRVFKGVDEKTKIVTRNLIAVPMRVKGEIVGVLEVINSIDKPCFDNNDLQLLQAFGDASGIAIYNRELIQNLKDLNKELERSFKEIKTMYEINKKLANETDVNKVFEVSVETISEIFQIERISILLYDELSGILKVKYAKGINDKIIPNIKILPGENVAGWVFKNDNPVLVKNMNIDKRFGKNKRLRYKTASFISIPVHIRGKKIGVLNLTDKKSGEEFNETDFETFNSIVSHISKNYENILYYNEFLEKQRIEKELEITKHIQQHILPKSFPSIKGLQIAAYNIPAKEVGGDFYDYIEINKNIHAFLIADVSGKSLPASMFMALSRSITRVEASNLVSPSKVLEESNKYIFKDSESGMFVTLFYMVIYTDEKLIKYGSAGHNEQLLYNYETDEFNYLKVKGIPLGISPDAKYQEGEIGYKPNDIVILYTDGVTEAINKVGEEFGLERLKNIISKSKDKDANGILNSIITEVEKYTYGVPQFDDITLLVIKFI